MSSQDLFPYAFPEPITFDTDVMMSIVQNAPAPGAKVNATASHLSRAQFTFKTMPKANMRLARVRTRESSIPPCGGVDVPGCWGEAISLPEVPCNKNMWSPEKKTNGPEKKHVVPTKDNKGPQNVKA